MHCQGFYAQKLEMHAFLYRLDFMEAHTISIEPALRYIQVFIDGTLIAESSGALQLYETPLPPVFYFPRGDVNMDILKRSDKTTRCPFKGDAAYYSIQHGDDLIENAIWTYENPSENVSVIKAYLAFDPQKVVITAE